MTSNDPGTPRAWYQLIGPGLITACVVIGPGSILTSSKVGAANGYSMAWVVVVAVVFMLIYMTLGARLGVTASESPADLVTKRAGRWLAAAIGLGVFFISAAFQFGNNLGVASAFEIFIGDDKPWLLGTIVVLFNAMTISFLFAFKNLYKAVERLMMVFVALMLSAFLINLLFAQPHWGELLLGFIPEFLRGVEPKEGEPLLDISVLAMVGTTFVITAAYFQAYLVRQKGWTHHELKEGARDTRVGAVIMCVITLMIMLTAATQFHDFTTREKKLELEAVAQVARQLEPTLGTHAKWLFALGVFSAAYSSFLVNSMIGGFILADGFGLGSKPEDFWPRLMTTLVLLSGMGVALFGISTGVSLVPAIIAAQAVTILAAPLMAGALLWLTNRKDVMGPDTNSVPRNIAAGLGFVLLLAMAGYTALVSIPKNVEKWQKTRAETTQAETTKR
jgi:NRAMP (natural resistance-associated macrophage protein)-like metal ion transporter